MNKKIILFLLLWHALLAHATPNQPLLLKFDCELGNTETTHVITINHNDQYDKVNRVTLFSHPARASLKLKLTLDGIDESRIGKISEKERTALLRKQKQIYPNNQSSSLSIPGKKVDSSKIANGIKRLQHFAWHSENTPTIPPVVEAALTIATAENSNNPNKIRDNYLKHTEQTEWQQTELTWRIGGQVALGFVLFYFARRIVLRYFSQVKPRVQSAVPSLQIEKRLLLPSASIDISPEVESLAENEMGFGTQKSHLIVEPVMQVSKGWAHSTSMEISHVAKQPLELPLYPTNLIHISPVVRSMISTIWNLAPSPLPSPPSNTVEVEIPEPVNLLADFNPKKYESSKAFLESRKALTIEQIIEWSKCVTGSQHSLPTIHKFG